RLTASRYDEDVFPVHRTIQEVGHGQLSELTVAWKPQACSRNPKPESPSDNLGQHRDDDPRQHDVIVVVGAPARGPSPGDG
ncbi:MAG: hypothetical protein WA962_09635, partial [Ornithinimicrobium sp.]